MERGHTGNFLHTAKKIENTVQCLIGLCVHSSVIKDAGLRILHRELAQEEMQEERLLVYSRPVHP